MPLLQTCFDLVQWQPSHSSLLRKLLMSILILCSSNPSHPHLLETLMLKRSHQSGNRMWICRDDVFKKEHDVGTPRCLSNMDRDFSRRIHTERGGDASTDATRK